MGRGCCSLTAEVDGQELGQDGKWGGEGGSSRAAGVLRSGQPEGKLGGMSEEDSIPCWAFPGLVGVRDEFIADSGARVGV